jgi:hypothetical protein
VGHRVVPPKKVLGSPNKAGAALLAGLEAATGRVGDHIPPPPRPPVRLRIPQRRFSCLLGLTTGLKVKVSTFQPDEATLTLRTWCSWSGPTLARTFQAGIMGVSGASCVAWPAATGPT